jgi:hypothetical protein
VKGGGGLRPQPVVDKSHRQKQLATVNRTCECVRGERIGRKIASKGLNRSSRAPIRPETAEGLGQREIGRLAPRAGQWVVEKLENQSQPA